MPELQTILFNGLWVLGLSILLAAWSYARYMAYQEGVKTRDKLNELTYVLVMDLGLLLFVSGMAATESRVWGRILWIVVGVLVIAHAVLQYLAARETHEEG